MDHTEFFSSVKNGQFARCYLLEGTEEHTKRRGLQMLTDAIGSGDMAVMNQSVLTDPTPDLLIADCETLPLMADRRLIVVRECSMLVSGVRPKDYDEDTAVKQLDAWLARIPDTCCLVFFLRGKADGRRKFYNVLKKHAVMVDFEPLDDRQLNQWIRQEIERGGKTVQPDACQALWFSVGRDLTFLSCEISKLIAYAGDEPEITTKHIEEVCFKSVEYKVFDLADTLLSGKPAAALIMAHRLLQDGEESLYLLSLLGRQCRIVRYSALLARSGLREYDIAPKIGIPAFAVKKALECARHYRPSQLREMARLCLDTEYRVKSGEMNEQGCLEAVMLHIISIRGENEHG